MRVKKSSRLMHNTIYKIGLVSENPTLTAEFYKDQFSYSEVITPNISKGSILLSGLAGPFLHIYPSEITELECGLHHISIAVEDVCSVILNMEKYGARRVEGFQKLLDAPSSVFMEDPEGILLQIVSERDKLTEN